MAAANTVLFQLYDVDGDGLVSVGDVETLLKSAAGESLTEEEVHKLAVSGLDNQDAVDFQGFALVCSPAHGTQTTDVHPTNVICAHPLSSSLCVRVRAAVPVGKRDHEKALVFFPETNVDLPTQPRTSRRARVRVHVALHFSTTPFFSRCVSFA